ncbi:hypothetical protein SAMN05444274_11822 [Mariniphaga anaerophila]|uniref:Transmembrane protein n=1 Tax=Mariniphaga anaerophila TaxID=1484053 RepID=A0A1M5G9W7_9BACT|nr:DUF6057 family protein [Mariniphaga anaerophila]SHG00610.1 hypothetical protein SAMN05444274_11822 [Mariniphaga anaerophila]
MNNIKHIKFGYRLFLVGYILIFGYYYWLGDYIFAFQENSFLLVWTPEYLIPFLLKPGGILELAGKILTQLYMNQFIGSLILSGIIILPSVLLYSIDRKLNTDHFVFSGFIYIIPTALLMLLQTFYYHFMEYNIGINAILLYSLFSTHHYKKKKYYLPLIMLPLFMYVAGAYTLVFIGTCIVLCLTQQKKRGILRYFLVIILETVITIVAFQKYFFLQPYSQILKFPLPTLDIQEYKLLLFSLGAIIVLHPLLLKNNALKLALSKLRYFQGIALVFILLLTSAAMYRLYNPQVINVIKMQKLITEKKWDKVIDFHENEPSRNLIGQFFYNIALSETNQLCDRLFCGQQDFGPKSLVLPWDNEHLNWGAHFFYSIGLINEAHRWAYEEFIVYGAKPQNTTLLAKTNLINGNYARAEKYIRLLKHTFNYRKEGKELEALLENPKSIMSHSEFKRRMENLPKNQFFIQVSDPQNNIPLMLKDNIHNTQALEYQMAWYLLTKDVSSIIGNIDAFKKADYKALPTHIEEAILAYQNSTKKNVNLSEYNISEKTQENFRKYVSSFTRLKNDKKSLQSYLKKEFGNTFWYYFHFQ